MIKTLSSNILELLIVCPFIFLSFKKAKNNYTLLFLFFGFFLLNSALLELPLQFKSLNIFGGDWNWSGKVYALIGSIIFYFSFRKLFTKTDFITFKQKEGSLKATIIATLAAIVAVIAMSIFLRSRTELNIEALGFQLTLPGFDEELSFRGIMLGILSLILAEKLKIGKLNLGNPSILITAILFGMIHAFDFDKNWHLQMNWIYFSYTFLYGYVLAWMTIKSKSILMAVVSHNLTNFIGTLVTMIK